MGLRIEPACPEDLSRIFEISSTVHREQYGHFVKGMYAGKFKRHYAPTQYNQKRYSASLRKKLKKSSFVLLKALIDGVIVGFISAQNNKKLVIVSSLFVDSAYQGRGVGHALFSRLIELHDSKPMKLDVIEENERAIHLYEKVGFVRGRTVRRKSFYGAPLIYMHRPSGTSTP